MKIMFEKSEVNSIPESVFLMENRGLPSEVLTMFSSSLLNLKFGNRLELTL